MILHYDHVLYRRGGVENAPERLAMLEGIVDAKRTRPDLTFDQIGATLQAEGLFPASCIMLALMTFHTLQGQQTFVLGKHLTSMLEHTSMEGVSRAELTLPYNTFYVALPDCEHRVWGGTRTQWHQIRGMYVYLSEGDDAGGDILTILAWGAENERSMGPGDDASIWVRLDLRSDEDLETQVFHLLRDRSNENNDPIIDTLDFDAILDGSQSDGITEEVREVQRETLTAMYRIAINLSLYLASKEPETQAPPLHPRVRTLRSRLTRARSETKRKKIQEQLDRLSKATVIQVGNSIEEAATRQVREHGSVKAHWVRGHYHAYWTGKGRTTRVRRWVMPYPKGTTAPAKRTYEVRDEQ